MGQGFDAVRGAWASVFRLKRDHRGPGRRTGGQGDTRIQKTLPERAGAEPRERMRSVSKSKNGCHFHRISFFFFFGVHRLVRLCEDTNQRWRGG